MSYKVLYNPALLINEMTNKEYVHDRNKWRRNVNVMKRKSNPIRKRVASYPLSLLVQVPHGVCGVQ